jgi:hypothetical protein
MQIQDEGVKEWQEPGISLRQSRSASRFCAATPDAETSLSITEYRSVVRGAFMMRVPSPVLGEAII